MLELLECQALASRAASRVLAGASGAIRNRALILAAGLIREGQGDILAANQIDVERGQSDNLSRSLLDRLSLNSQRVEAMARGLEEVAALPDPLGKESSWSRPNGLLIRRRQVPLGVLCIIYEARPNVTVESASLAIKSGNSCLLRGSRSAHHSNQVLVEILRRALELSALPPDAVQAVGDSSRDSIDVLSRMRGKIDCIIPRGGADLIQRVVLGATVPVLETGVGNCHLYVHQDADLSMAQDLVENAKCSRPAVCNALETLLVDKAVAHSFLPSLGEFLRDKGVRFRACPAALPLLVDAEPAQEEDWVQEYLDLLLAVRVVDGLEQALEHILRYSSGHTEAIVTNNLEVARRFQNEVDACAVNVNASTRFTDGGEFGFGAEIGISTQKFHARGPVGLDQLTTCKYLVEGQGQVRT